MPKKMPSNEMSTKLLPVPRPVDGDINYELHALDLTNRISEQIHLPSGEYRIDCLLPTGPERGPIHSTFFESHQWCRNEDIRRSFELKRAAENLDIVLQPAMDKFGRHEAFTSGVKLSIRIMMLDLAARLQRDSSAILLPSAGFKRDQRIRLLGAIMRLLDADRNIPVSLVRIQRTDARWRFPGFDLWLDNVGPHTGIELRDALRRAHILEADGFFIAHYDVELLPPFDMCQLYFYAIVAGEKIQALQNLSKLSGYGHGSISYEPFPFGHHRLWDSRVASALSGFWPQQTWRQFGFRIKPDNAARPNGFRNQHQALYLSLFDHQAVSNVFIFDGVSFIDGELNWASPRERFSTIDSF
jgi:hypothetical protein